VFQKDEDNIFIFLKCSFIPFLLHHSQKIYISYDSTNKNGQAGEIDFVEYSQLQYSLEKANGYGYKNVGSILDRGYFSKENIHYMDKCGYEFVIMMKGMKEFVKNLVLQVKGTFEEDRKYSVRPLINDFLRKMAKFRHQENQDVSAGTRIRFFIDKPAAMISFPRAVIKYL